jgi:hypothetical protein
VYLIRENYIINDQRKSAEILRHKLVVTICSTGNIEGIAIAVYQGFLPWWNNTNQLVVLQAPAISKDYCIFG